MDSGLRLMIAILGEEEAKNILKERVLELGMENKLTMEAELRAVGRQETITPVKGVLETLTDKKKKRLW